jgi:hypothetical protein
MFYPFRGDGLGGVEENEFVLRIDFDRLDVVDGTKTVGELPYTGQW